MSGKVMAVSEYSVKSYYLTVTVVRYASEYYGDDPDVLLYYVSGRNVETLPDTSACTSPESPLSRCDNRLHFDLPSSSYFSQEKSSSSVIRRLQLTSGIA